MGSKSTGGEKNEARMDQIEFQRGFLQPSYWGDTSATGHFHSAESYPGSCWV